MVAGNPYWRGRLSTNDLLIKKNIITVIKAADLNYLVQGGQLDWSFPFSKGSLMVGSKCDALSYTLSLLPPTPTPSFDVDVLKSFEIRCLWNSIISSRYLFSLFHSRRHGHFKKRVRAYINSLSLSLSSLTLLSLSLSRLRTQKYTFNRIHPFIHLKTWATL